MGAMRHCRVSLNEMTLSHVEIVRLYKFLAASSTWPPRPHGSRYRRASSGRTLADTGGMKEHVSSRPAHATCSGVRKVLESGWLRCGGRGMLAHLALVAIALGAGVVLRGADALVYEVAPQ